jgi:hypothetical protein
MCGANRFMGPFRRDIGMIAEFGRSLATGRKGERSEQQKKQGKRKDPWTHGEALTLRDSPKCVKPREKIDDRAGRNCRTTGDFRQP